MNLQMFWYLSLQGFVKWNWFFAIRNRFLKFGAKPSSTLLAAPRHNNFTSLSLSSFTFSLHCPSHSNGARRHWATVVMVRKLTKHRGQVIYWVKGSVRVLFWNLHSRGERGRKGRECKIQNKAHRIFDQTNTLSPLLTTERCGASEINMPKHDCYVVEVPFWLR